MIIIDDVIGQRVIFSGAALCLIDYIRSLILFVDKTSYTSSPKYTNDTTG